MYLTITVICIYYFVSTISYKDIYMLSKALLVYNTHTLPTFPMEHIYSRHYTYNYLHNTNTRLYGLHSALYRQPGK